MRIVSAMLTDVPRITRTTETRNDRPNCFSSIIAWYDERLKLTGQKETCPSEALVLSLREMAMVLRIGTRQIRPHRMRTAETTQSETDSFFFAFTTVPP